ncbi:MAG: hypothetical protein AAF149_04160 [Bacteroidota bacterium]
MNIDLVLISLQALFITLYGVFGIIQSKSYGQRRWVVVSVSYLAVSMLCFFFPDHVKGNIQLILFFLLLLDYLFRSLVFSNRWVRVVLLSMLLFLSYGLLYLEVENRLAWIAVPFIFGASFMCMKKWQSGFGNVQSYFLSAGTLLTILFMLEPIFISVQKNLKPIPTIPTSSIINQQNFLLLGALLVLALGGFFWKEKSRL